MTGAYRLTGIDSDLIHGAVYILEITTEDWLGNLAVRIVRSSTTSYPIFQVSYENWEDFRKDWEPVS